MINLPDKDLAYLREGTEHFDGLRRRGGLGAGLRAGEPRADDGRGDRAPSRRCRELPPFDADAQAVNCHHNYVAREHHYGENVLRHAQGRGARA